MIIELRRSIITDNGAFGLLVINNLPLNLTLERTFGKENKIVIPKGDHPCHRDYYHKGKYETFEIDVQGSGIEPGRKHKRVLLHAANIEDQLEGCVATGTKFIWYKGKRGIGNSKSAHRDFIDALIGVNKFILRVTNP